MRTGRANRGERGKRRLWPVGAVLLACGLAGLGSAANAGGITGDATTQKVQGVQAAQAAGEPVEDGPWTSYDPSYNEQERGCGRIDGETFTLTCSDGDGDQRAERRYETYTSGTRQFEGYFTITEQEGSRISLKQTFHDQVGAYYMLAVEKGGRLYAVHGGDTIDTGATVGTAVRVNTVHDVGSEHRTYINGSLKHTTSSTDGAFYDKLGAYRTQSGQGPITVKWTDISFWHK